MSADNGIYILCTKDGYHVKEMAAVENYMWDEDRGKETKDPDVWIKNAREMWDGCTCHETIEEAYAEAIEILKKIKREGWFVEYGIVEINVSRNFYPVDMKASYFQKNGLRRCFSPEYNWLMNMSTGYFMRWGKNTDEDPQLSPFGPEILDIEISTRCSQGCPQCYKSNVAEGDNMSLDNYVAIMRKIPPNVSQIAFGIGDIDGNPDLQKIMEHTREIGLVPNITINGYRMTDEYFDMLARLCGAVAVSHYGDDACFNAIEQLTNRGMAQVNIHKVLAEETAQSCFDLIKKSKEDPRLAKLNAIVFLLLKPKGDRNTMTVLKDNTVYRDLLLLANELGVSIGMDSCSGPSMLKGCEGVASLDTRSLETCVEPCESSCFSFYINALGEGFPCSFCEGETGWEKGIDLYQVTDFIKEVWNSTRITAWRAKLLGSTSECSDCKFQTGCRACPQFDLTPCLGG